MMLRAVFAGFLTMNGLCSSQPPDMTWIGRYGGLDNEHCRTLARTDDGQLLLGGTVLSDITVVKAEETGNLLWMRRYGGILGEECNACVSTADGGCVVAGSTWSGDYGTSDFLLMKLDAGGDSLWTKIYGGGAEDRCQAAIRTHDQGFLIGGRSRISSSSTTDIWLIKTDSNGDSLWSRRYGGSADDACNSILQLDDGTFVVAGYTRSFGAGSADVWLIKLDANGDSLWSRTFGDTASESCSQICATADGGFILAGNRYSQSIYYSDFLLVKVDSNGNSAWLRSYLGPSFFEDCRSVLQTPDGGYLLGGNRWSIDDECFEQAMLLKVNFQGDSDWEIRTYGCEAGQTCTAVLRATDGGYLFAGDYRTPGNEDIDFDFGLVKLAPELVSDEPSLPSRLNYLGNYPNPFNATTTLEFVLSQAAQLTIQVYDVVGRSAGSVVSDWFAAGQHEIQWECASCASGIYFVRMSGENFGLTKKMVLLR